MIKKYIVRLSDKERKSCTEVIKKLKGTSLKVRRAQILLKADADGPAWVDTKISEALNCRIQTVENLRKRLVTEGFEITLDGKKRSKPPTSPLLDGKGEAKLIAMRLGKPPAGYGMEQQVFSCFRNLFQGFDKPPLVFNGQRLTGHWRWLTYLILGTQMLIR